MALYTGAANLDSTTTAYTAVGEVAVTGYVAGGLALTNITPTSSGSTTIVTFNTPIVWSGVAGLIARGALIYNSSKANRAVAVLDFGMDRRATVGTFTVNLPLATATSALIRL